jgi:hypothetical protein
MAKPWIDSVKQSGKLTVYDGIGGGKWSSLFQQSLNEFNELLKGSGLSLTFEKAADEASAQVVVKISDGPASFEYGKDKFSYAFNGKGLHGFTGQVSRGTDPRIEKAFVFLPSNPQMNTYDGLRPTGIGVMKCILVHEFVHACGLENKDHGTDDVFHGSPQTNYGDTAAEDKIGIRRDGKYIWFPPVVLSSATIGKIKALW